jgi:ribosomal protein S18 acetylase RimI-like enzyme
MNVVDWSDAPFDRLAPLYAAERQRWLRELQWDPEPGWGEVEQARTTWGLPGALAIDDGGRVRGLAFYVREDDRLDVGGIIADHVDATDALLDGMLAAAHETGARRVRTMLFDEAGVLRSGLARRGFEVGLHLYLSCAFPNLTGVAKPSPATRPVSDQAGLRGLTEDCWNDEDVCTTAALLRRSYDPMTGSLFAPHGNVEEWERYVENLTHHAACGVLNPQASRVIRHGRDIVAIALVTDIAPRTAHLVQLAVDPRLRGRHVGAALVSGALTRLGALGYQAVTLLVAQGNQAAWSLYDAAGFRHDATFLAANLDVHHDRST